MKVAVLLIGVLTCSDGALGWGWGGDHPQQGAPRSDRPSSFDKLANSNELYSADILGHSDTPPPPSSCFMSAFQSLPAEIPCEAIAQSDTLKAKAAVSMTLCDLRTSDEFKIPRECTDWEHDKNGATATSCVGALSRAGQYSAPYYNYLNQIATFCAASRQRAELEEARALHHASAKAYAHFADSMAQLEKARAKRERKAAAADQQRHQEVATAASGMAVVVAELVNERQLREAELAAFQGKLELSLAVMADRFGELSTQHFEQLQMVAQQVRRLMTAAEGDMALWLGQVRGELANLQGGISQQHSFIQHTNHLLQTNHLLVTTNNHLVQTSNDGLTVVLGQTVAVAEQNRAIAFVAAQNLALVNEQRALMAENARLEAERGARLAQVDAERSARFEQVEVERAARIERADSEREARFDQSAANYTAKMEAASVVGLRIDWTTVVGCFKFAYLFRRNLGDLSLAEILSDGFKCLSWLSLCAGGWLCSALWRLLNRPRAARRDKSIRFRPSAVEGWLQQSRRGSAPPARSLASAPACALERQTARGRVSRRR